MITGSRNGNLGASLKTQEFMIQSGVPVEKGGSNEGPDPHELLEAALAGCTIITVQMYANHKGWPLETTNVVVKITSESPEKSEISREVEFVGNLSAEQRQRLLEIANKCPIHRLLSSSISISTSMKPT